MAARGACLLRHAGARALTAEMLSSQVGCERLFPRRPPVSVRGRGVAQGGAARTGSRRDSPVDVFRAGLGGYRVFRIPALARSGRTLLAFAEARPTVDDHGKIELVFRRSPDGGKSWDPLQVVAGRPFSRHAGSMQTAGNPSAAIAADGTVVLVFCSNEWHVNEETIRAGKGGAGRRVWVSRSADAGGNWSAPVEITQSVKREGWTWYATGPGGATRLPNGTLVVPATHATAEGSDH